MIKIENTEVVGWEHAIRGMRAKGYRKTKSGKYECFVSVEKDTVMLGTVETEDEAIRKVFDFRKIRLMSSVGKYGLHLKDSRVYKGRYIVFENGMIFNIHGHLMVGVVDKNGYVHGLLCGKNIQFHRVIAEMFCDRKDGKDFVNHKDGNKQNNSASNLEWVTRSENTLHSFKNGLQDNVAGTKIYTQEEKQYIQEHCNDRIDDVANYLNRNRETVRKYMQKARKGVLI